MITGPKNKEWLNSKECIERLEGLFKIYQKDSEFNYQLSVNDSSFNQLKELVMWKPMEEYFKTQHDWVLVQFEERHSGFRGLPHVAEFRMIDNKWHTNANDDIFDNYLNNDCLPIAFKELDAYLL